MKKDEIELEFVNTEDGAEQAGPAEAGEQPAGTGRKKSRGKDQEPAKDDEPGAIAQSSKSQSGDEATNPAASDNASKEPRPSVLQQIKEEAHEGDEAPTASLSLREIVGGDYLVTLMRNHIWLIILIVLFITGYVAVRYQCQQDVIRIAQLEKQLKDAKFKALSSKSSLTILCRQSNIIEGLKANHDSLIKNNLQPPYRVEVPEK